MVQHEEKSKRLESEAAGHLASLVRDAERCILALHLAFFFFCLVLVFNPC